MHINKSTVIIAGCNTSDMPYLGFCISQNWTIYNNGLSAFTCKTSKTVESDLTSVASYTCTADYYVTFIMNELS